MVSRFGLLGRRPVPLPATGAHDSPKLSRPLGARWVGRGGRTNVIQDRPTPQPDSALGDGCRSVAWRLGCPIGADQFDPLGEVEPPRPGPGRGLGHPKRSATGVLDRVGQVRVAWSEWMGPDAGSEVPDQRPGAGAQDAADLGQAGRRVGPVVHRQGADDQVEGSVGEARAATSPTSNDGRRWSRFPGGRRWLGPGRSWPGPGPGRSRPARAGGPAGSTGGRVRSRPPGPVPRWGRPPPRRPRCFDERAEQESAQGVVDAGVADEDASRYPVASGGPAAVSQDGDGRGGRPGQDRQVPRSDHHASTRYPRALAGAWNPAFLAGCGNSPPPERQRTPAVHLLWVGSSRPFRCRRSAWSDANAGSRSGRDRRRRVHGLLMLLDERASGLAGVIQGSGR